MAAAAGVETSGGFTLGRRWRVAMMALPTLVALVVAAEIGTSARGGSVVYAALIGLSAVVVAGLS